MHSNSFRRISYCSTNWPVYSVRYFTFPDCGLYFWMGLQLASGPALRPRKAYWYMDLTGFSRVRKILLLRRSERTFCE